jgi:hypothetical protein
VIDSSDGRVSIYHDWTCCRLLGPPPSSPARDIVSESALTSHHAKLKAWSQRMAETLSDELDRKIAMLRSERDPAVRIAGADAVISGPATNGSAGRLNVMLRCLNRAPPEVFWPVFLKAWPNCDGTWAQKERLLARLRRQGSGVDHLPERTREWLGTLQYPITIYRGCSRGRSRGLSWTTDRDVALSFAREHRGMAVPDAVIVTAMVSKADVFAAFLERDESELLVEPKSFRMIKYEQTGIRPVGGSVLA